MLINKSIISALMYLGYIALVVSGKRTTGRSVPRKGNGIDVPLGNILIKNVHGVGTQDYKCTNGKFKIFDERAVLYDPDDRRDKEGTYDLNGKSDGKGGKAEFVVNGSRAIFKVTGRDISVVATNMPDLRYTVTSTGNTGLLANCTFVQRRNTFGGVAPTTKCTEGVIVKVQYQADYAFFGKGKKGRETPGGSPSDDLINIPKNFNGTKAPSGENKVLLKLHAIGVQIYQCKNGTFQFRNAQSDLYQLNDRSFTEGRHFFNTNPDENGGRAAFVVRDSTAVFKKIGEKKSSNPKNIPEILLVRTSSTPGALGEVTFLRRTNNIGGVAPAGACTAGTPDARVPYESDYVFYTGKAPKKQTR